MSKVEKVFMSIKVGQKSEENELQGFKRHIGVAPVFVVAVNPNKEELSKIQGREIENEPEYMGQTSDGKNNLRLDFWVKTDPEWGNKIDTLSKVTFFINSKPVCNKDETKVKVIDKYGQTAWVNKEEFGSKTIPGYAQRMIGDYNPCHQGEDELIQFLKAWLNIPESTHYENGSWVRNKNLADCEVQLNWDALVKGNIKELKDLVNLAKDYKVKVCFGVRTADDNKQYQDICNRVFLKNASSYYQRFQKEIKNIQDNGGYPNTEFSSDILMEYQPQKTEFINTVKENVQDKIDEFTKMLKGDDTQTAQEMTNDLPF